MIKSTHIAFFFPLFFYIFCCCWKPLRLIMGEADWPKEKAMLLMMIKEKQDRLKDYERVSQQKNIGKSC